MYCVLSIFNPEIVLNTNCTENTDKGARLMPDGTDRVRNLTKNTENLNTTNSKEEEIINLIQALEQKIKFLENRNVDTKARNNEHCSFKDACYTVRSKMGSCPCELYR